MKKRSYLTVCGPLIATAVLLAACGGAATRAQTEPLPPAQKQTLSPATRPNSVLVSKATNTLDLRDAPIRSALELLLNFCDASYSIDPMIGNPEVKSAGEFATKIWERDLTTARFANKPFDETLRLLCQSARSPVAISIERDETHPLIYVLKPEKRAALLQASVNEDSEETEGRPGEKGILPYRVCGILRHDEPGADKKAPSTTWLALLTRDVPGRPGYALAKVVRTSAWLAAVDENSPPLRVTGIDAKGVTLQPLDGAAYKLPLASVSERAKPTATTAIPVVALAASQPVFLSSAPEADREIEEAVDTLTLRGASSRSAIELVFQVNNIRYVIDEAFSKTARTNMERYVVRHKSKEDTFETLFKSIARVSSVGLSMSSPDPAGENRRWFIKPRQDSREQVSPTPILPPVNPSQSKYVNERQVPRRVRGLLFRDVYYRGSRQPKTMPYALLETDTPGVVAPTATEIVKTGTLIASPIKGGPPVRVVGIDTEGIWLQAEGDEPFRVALEPLPKE